MKVHFQRLSAFLHYNRLLGPVMAKFDRRDEFDWQTYTKERYRPQLEQLSASETRQLSAASWRIENGRIELEPTAYPLPPGPRLIYETAIALNPKSVFECGCGAGDHLANLALLLPDATVVGVDVSENQLAYALRRNPHLKSRAKLMVHDMTKPEVGNLLSGSAEFVYSKDVIMHVHGGDRHLTFLRNLVHISSRYILLLEHWIRHPFVKDLHSLFPGRTTYMVSNGSAIGILLDSRNSLDYPVITRDSEIRKAFNELSKFAV